MKIVDRHTILGKLPLYAVALLPLVASASRGSL